MENEGETQEIEKEGTEGKNTKRNFVYFLLLLTAGLGDFRTTGLERVKKGKGNVSTPGCKSLE